MSEAKKLVERRKDYLHGLWGQGSTGAIGYIPARPPHGSRDVTVEDLHTISADMDRLSDQAGALVAQVEVAVL